MPCDKTPTPEQVFAIDLILFFMMSIMLLLFFICLHSIIRLIWHLLLWTFGGFKHRFESFKHRFESFKLMIESAFMQVLILALDTASMARRAYNTAGLYLAYYVSLTQTGTAKLRLKGTVDELGPYTYFTVADSGAASAATASAATAPVASTAAAVAYCYQWAEPDAEGWKTILDVFLPADVAARGPPPHKLDLWIGDQLSPIQISVCFNVEKCLKTVDIISRDQGEVLRTYSSRIKRFDGYDFSNILKEVIEMEKQQYTNIK